MFSKATIKERRQYYREEWDPSDLPEFIAKDIKKREFGFDHNGRGPNDRYKVFRGTQKERSSEMKKNSIFAAVISLILAMSMLITSGCTSEKETETTQPVSTSAQSVYDETEEISDTTDSGETQVQNESVTVTSTATAEELTETASASASAFC